MMFVAVDQPLAAGKTMRSVYTASLPGPATKPASRGGEKVPEPAPVPQPHCRAVALWPEASATSAIRGVIPSPSHVVAIEKVTAVVRDSVACALGAVIDIPLSLAASLAGISRVRVTSAFLKMQ